MSDKLTKQIQRMKSSLKNVSKYWLRKRRPGPIKDVSSIPISVLDMWAICHQKHTHTADVILLRLLSTHNITIRWILTDTAFNHWLLLLFRVNTGTVHNILSDITYHSSENNKRLESVAIAMQWNLKVAKRCASCAAPL